MKHYVSTLRILLLMNDEERKYKMKSIVTNILNSCFIIINIILNNFIQLIKMSADLDDFVLSLETVR
jgi:hypothetical protein